MAVEITYKIIGNNNFLRQPEYSFYIFNFLKEFEEKFQLAEKVEIEFEDDINPDSNNIKPRDYEVSENGKEIKLVYKTSRNFLPKGGISKPEEQSFFSGFRYYFINTIIKEDNERFEQLSINQEEE